MEKLFEICRGPLRPAGPRHAADPQRARLPRGPAAPDPVHRGPRCCRCSCGRRASRESRSRRLDGPLGAQADHWVDLLQDLSEFFQAFSGMVGGFQERARRVNELLADRARRFWSSAVHRASRSRRPSTSTAQAGRGELPFGGVIVNKVHSEPEVDATRTRSSPSSPRCGATRTWPAGDRQPRGQPSPQSATVRTTSPARPGR